MYWTSAILILTSSTCIAIYLQEEKMLFPCLKCKLVIYSKNILKENDFNTQQFISRLSSIWFWHSFQHDNKAFLRGKTRLWQVSGWMRSGPYSQGQTVHSEPDFSKQEEGKWSRCWMIRWKILKYSHMGSLRVIKVFILNNAVQVIEIPSLLPGTNNDM